MSLPSRDPNFTMDDLQKVGVKLLDAAMEYWEAAHKAGINGAVIWLQGDKGLVVFTRGEYRRQIMQNIELQGSPRFFGSTGEEE